jgi:hypothetical protein
MSEESKDELKNLIEILSSCEDGCALHNTECKKLNHIASDGDDYDGTCMNHVNEYNRYLVLQGIIKDCKECISKYGLRYEPLCSKCETFQRIKEFKDLSDSDLYTMFNALHQEFIRRSKQPYKIIRRRIQS